MARTTPYSQLANILLFVPSVLINDHFILLVLQVPVFLCAAFLFRLRYRTVRPAQLVHLLPVILFICLLNAVKGGGETLVRAGPLLITRQGMTRGVLLSVFVIELYFMSRILTDAFDQKTLLKALSAIDKMLHLGKERGEVMVLLYHVMRIFRNSYGELRVFFRREGQSLRMRVLRFFRESFFRSLREYEPAEGRPVENLKPVAADYVYVCIQAAAVTGSFFLHGVL